MSSCQAAAELAQTAVCVSLFLGSSCLYFKILSFLRMSWKHSNLKIVHNRPIAPQTIKKKVLCIRVTTWKNKISKGISYLINVLRNINRESGRYFILPTKLPPSTTKKRIIMSKANIIWKLIMHYAPDNARLWLHTHHTHPHKPHHHNDTSHQFYD